MLNLFDKPDSVPTRTGSNGVWIGKPTTLRLGLVMRLVVVIPDEGNLANEQQKYEIPVFHTRELNELARRVKGLPKQRVVIILLGVLSNRLRSTDPLDFSQGGCVQAGAGTDRYWKQDFNWKGAPSRG